MPEVGEDPVPPVCWHVDSAMGLSSRAIFLVLTTNECLLCTGCCVPQAVGVAGQGLGSASSSLAPAAVVSVDRHLWLPSCPWWCCPCAAI